MNECMKDRDVGMGPPEKSNNIPYQLKRLNGRIDDLRGAVYELCGRLNVVTEIQPESVEVSKKPCVNYTSNSVVGRSIEDCVDSVNDTILKIEFQLSNLEI